MARHKPAEPGVFTGTDYLPYLGIFWGVPHETVLDFVQSGLLTRNRFGFVDRSAVLKFLNSSEGMAALAQARNG